MGCDIHPVVQRRVNGRWEDVSHGGTDEERRDPLEWRNYESFAVLADVRNNFDITPVASYRGFPKDFQILDDYLHPCSQHSGKVLEQTSGGNVGDTPWDCHDCIAMGDHSYNWVTLDELNGYDWNALVVESIVVSWDAYVEWVQGGRSGLPRSYCRSAGGGNVVNVRESEVPDVPVETLHEVHIEPGKMVYVNVDHKMPVRECCLGLHEKVLPWLRTLGDPPDVRIVMGFDS